MAEAKRTLRTKLDEVYAQIPEALKSEGFGVLTEIDVQETLKKKIGADFRRYKILGACNPGFAHRALSTALEVGVLLPCNVGGYEGADGRAVVLAIDPMQTVAAGDPRLSEIAIAVKDKLGRVLGQLS